MEQQDKNFHELSLKSILFKGRADWYFCYLKSEKIAHVLNLLAQESSFKDAEDFAELLSAAGRLPHTVVHFIAGEVEAAVVLADIFSLLSLVRLSATKGYILQENTAVLAGEYESIAKKVMAQNRPSPFISSRDFAVEMLEEPQREGSLLPQSSLLERTSPGASLKDKSKGQIKDTRSRPKGQEERMSLILEFVKKNKGVSIKEIAGVVRGCSEKTIQRELATLVRQGLIERRGERRWSLYLPAPTFS